MKKIYFLMLLNAAFMNIVSAQSFDWAKVEGLWAYDYGYGITTDKSGNVYVAGKYEMNANFSGTILPCQGNHDIYVAQYSASGNLNWITTAGGELGDYAEGVAVDDNYVYTAGEIEGTNKTIVFQNSPITLHTYSLNDIFVAKYDMSGSLIWAKSAGWYQNEKALSVACDNSGNVYVCGFFNDTALFDNTFIYGYGKNDIYLAKYDANGNFQWVRKAGSAGRDEAKGVKCDAQGNIYITGMYSNGCVFGNQTLTCSDGYYNIFTAKYDPSGNLQWVRTAGDAWDDVAWAITIDNAGKVYIAGEIVGYVVFGSAPPLVTSGFTDIFVACYDANGNVQWATKAGGPLVERARGIGTDGNNLYITGQFGSTVTFDSHSITAVDSSDIYVAALNNSGNFLWAVSVGGPADSLETLGYECGNTVCADASGNVYATGSLLDGGTFGSTSLQKYGRTDVFITKITQAGVGVNETELANMFSVFPNPSLGEFMVQNKTGNACEYKILDVCGNNVCAGKLVSNLSVLRPNVSEGVYFLEVKDGGKTYREKLVRQ